MRCDLCHLLEKLIRAVEKLCSHRGDFRTRLFLFGSRKMSGQVLNVNVGASGTSAVVNTDIATGQPVVASVEFSVDQPTIVSVDPVTGNWNALASGTAVITETSVANGFTHTDSSQVVVAAADSGDFTSVLTLTANP